MALTAQEQAELDALEAELGSAPPQSFTTSLGHGLRYAAERASRGLADTVGWLGSDYVGRPLKQALIKHGFVPSDEQLAASKARATGAGGFTGQVLGDIAITAVPGSILTKASRVKGVVPFLSDVATQMGLGALFAPEGEKTVSAVSGAGGATAGKVASSVIAGPLRQTLSPEARKLTEAGISLSPGHQMKGTGAGTIPRFFAGGEETFSRIPLLGAPVNYRYAKSVEEYNTRVINDLLKPLGQATVKTGREGIEDATSKIKKIEAEIAPELEMPHAGIDDLYQKLFETGDLLKKPEYQTIAASALEKFKKDLDRELGSFYELGATISGPVAKQLADKFKYYAKNGKYGSDTATIRQLWDDVQDHWFSTLSLKPGADPAYREVLRNIHEAQKSLQLFERAGAKDAVGLFTPSRVTEIAGKAPDELTEAASRILPHTLPRMDVGSNSVMHRLTAPSGVSGAAALGSFTGLAALQHIAPAIATAGALYTRPSVRYMAQGAMPLVRRVDPNLSPEDAAFMAQLLMSAPTRAALTAAKTRQED